MRARLFDRPGGPSTLTELLAAPGIREEVAIRSRFGFMAIHGGDLELMTDVIARTAAERGGASYYGVSHPVGLDRHLASVRYRADESDALSAFLGHVDTVVSIHGYGRAGRWMSLLFGGRNRALAEELAGAIGARLPDYEMITELEAIPRELRGSSRRNPVNVPGRCGVQLELPPRVRGTSPLSPPRGADGFAAPTRALIDGLVSVARTSLGASPHEASDSGRSQH